MALALEAVLRRPPAVFVDTAGYAFSYPVVKLLLGGRAAGGGGGGKGGGCLVVCYTHYPTISGDMLQRVQQRTSMYNNDDTVANSAILSSSKLYYYRFFALLYGWAGGHADITMVNSSWTEGHIRRIWTRNKPSSVHRVYPPCDTTALQALPLSRPASKYIISVAQFRPEKLRAFAQAIKPAPPSDPTADAQSEPDPMAGVRLKLVGSSRHREDEKRIELLGCLAVSLGVERRVDFIVNTPFREDEKRIELLGCLAASFLHRQQLAPGGREADRAAGVTGIVFLTVIERRVDFIVKSPFRELQQLLGGATCGIHTMWDEHFGISVVEYMAAGAVPIEVNWCLATGATTRVGTTCGVHSMWDEMGISVVEYMAAGAVPIAHNSAGPKMDIVVPACHAGCKEEDRQEKRGGEEGDDPHNSAGPKMDIVVPAFHAGLGRKEDGQEKGGEVGDGEGDKEGGEGEQSEPLIWKGQLEADSSGCPVGYLAMTEDEYTVAMRAVFAMSVEERERIATAGRERAKRFSEENFDKSFKDVLRPVLDYS
ncbi:unnamed protein product [Closterium sp. NIES-64]|nr:unnamed protein product [Closterium sp. NIES-64]